ncbi:MAG: sigma-70 family RNA polymerase sigma factor [Planctomycetota bacterium]
MSEATYSREQTLRLLLSRRSALIAYLHVYVCDLYAAEDLFQEVALRALEKHPDIRDEASAYAWLRKVARNCAIDWLRRNKRQPITLEAETLELLDLQWAQDKTRNSNELHESLSECISQLTPRARQLVEQRFKNQMTTREIAEASGRKTDSIYTAFSRIYSALADCLRAKLHSTEVGHG